MLAAAERTVLVADAGKFPGRGIARVCGPEALAAVVTDECADPETLECLRGCGVEVLTAAVEATR
jgi:DeoR/GlpR family transcriptional regulator of sugar metabolism